MTVEADIFNALKGFVPNGNGTFRVYPDVARDFAARPYIVFQQVGGEAVNFLDPTMPSKRNARFQISVWTDAESGGRTAVAALSRQVEDAMRAAASLQTIVLGAPVAMYEEDTKLYGTRQDFSVWF